MKIGFRYPDEVVVTDVAGTPADGAATPAGEPDDDFFSSWDKPAIKRPSNPPSRVGTPSNASRTASPFLNAGANGNGARSKSPLSASDKDDTSSPPPAVRAGNVVRKAPASSGAKKGSILSSKKTQKLGAKKIVSADAIDFEEAERKAKEEAERIEKLGYDPEAEQADIDAKEKAAATTKIAAPTPISPARGGFGSTGKAPEKSAAELERLGMGMSRLGFGQVSKPVVAKKPGFGAVGPAQRSAADGKFHSSLQAFFCKASNEIKQRKKLNKTEHGSERKKVSRPTNSLAESDSTRQHRQKPSLD